MTSFFYTIALVVFLAIIGIHLTKKNTNCVLFYIIQSSAVALLLFVPAFAERNLPLMLAAVLTLSIKAVVAPFFFSRLIKKHKMTFTSNTYLSLPLTLIIISLLSMLAYHSTFQPLLSLFAEDENAIRLALATIFISIFLIINRRGAMSQIIGVLSLENGIVSLVSFLGAEQSASLDIGVSFDIAVWVIIAALFLSMIYKQFGTLDVGSMKKLKEE